MAGRLLNGVFVTEMKTWAECTGSDLFSIVVVEPYSSDYDECMNRVTDEKTENVRTELNP